MTDTRGDGPPRAALVAAIVLAVVAVVAAAITWRLDHPKFLRADVR